jgi:hypothetical protein
MRNKLAFVGGFALGYVLGARAGRERYEQIRRGAQSFARNPQVQEKASTLQHQAGEVLGTAASKAADVGGNLAGKAQSTVSGRMPGRDKGRTPQTDEVTETYLTTETTETETTHPTDGRSSSGAW